MTDTPAAFKVREEFNQWAVAGRGEEMEDHHLPIVAPVLPLMAIKPHDHVLDLGCGSGWLCRRIARLVPQGRVVGVDIAAEMVRRARAASKEFANLNFVEGLADKIPCGGGAFNKIISVESAYYWPDPAASVREMFRVLRSGGSAWILINYYVENPHSHQWGSIINLPTRLLSIEDWKGLYRGAGFVNVEHRQIPDPTPVPENYSGRWFRDAEQMKNFHQVGALLVYGTKPGPSRPVSPRLLRNLELGGGPPTRSARDNGMNGTVAEINQGAENLQADCWQLSWLNHLSQRIARHRGVAGMSLAAAAFIVFSGSLGNGFVYDDNPQVLQNPFILNSHLWKQIFTGSVWSFQGGKTNFYRPLQFACYWILYRIGGPNPALFHLLNLLLYAVSVLLVYRVARALLAHEFVSLVGALLWALHPVHVEAVTWISALPDVGFAFFALLAFLCFLRAEHYAEARRIYHVPAVLLFFIALFFKEMALSFTILLFAYWFYLGKPESWWRRLERWLPYAAATLAYIVIRHHVLGYLTQSGHLWKVPLRVFGAAFGLMGQDTKILIWPVHLNVFRIFHLGPSLLSPWPWITILALIGTVWLRRREPSLAFLISWWPVTLIPVLDIRQLSFPQLADRFLYFPSVGPSLAAVYVILIWLPQCFHQEKLVPAAGCALGLVMVFYAAQTVRAIPNWRDNRALVDYSLTQSPNSPLLLMARGVVREYEHGDLDGALADYNRARELNQRSSWPLNMDHDYFLAVGRIALRKANVEEAIEDFKKAQRAAPDSSQPSDALGAIYFPKGEYAKASEYFQRSVKVDPEDLTAHFYLGACWMKLGMYRDAASEFHTAREIDPKYWQAYEAEANALEAAGEFAKAQRVRSEIKKQ